MIRRTNRVNVKELKTKDELTTLEKAGMQKIIKEAFESRYDFNPLPYCNFTHIGDYYGLTYQPNETELEEGTGICLSSFAVTKKGDLIAVCFDENDDYVFYEVE